MIQNIIFDFGGVILQHGQEFVAHNLSKIFTIPHEEAQTFWKEHETAIMTGQINSGELLQELKDKTHTQKSLDELLKEWKALYIKESQGVNYELLDYITELKKKYKVYLFTDTIDTHDEYNSTRGIYEKFDRVFKSFEEGLRKPNIDSFENVFKKIEAQADECVFIDDREINVSTGKKLGMQGIVFTSTNQTKQELNSLITE